jgi:hypothetical protein
MKTKKNIVLVASLIAAILTGTLLLRFGSSAQSGDSCLGCDTTRFSCITSCEIAENSCLENPDSDGANCAAERALCEGACNSTWNSCRQQNCGPTPPGGGGGGSSGKDPDCVSYCDELEGSCLNGNPLDPDAYTECINNGGTSSECCRAQRDSCVDSCPACDPQVNCPKNP